VLRPKIRFPEITGEELTDLLNRVEEKDQTAFERVYYVYFGRVSNFLRTKLYGQDDSIQAIANEVFFEIWRKPNAFNGSSRFSTFLLGIAKNKLLQHWGRQDPDPSPVAEDEDLLDTLPSDEPPPELKVLEQEKMNILRDCADKHLNALQRTVVLDRLLFGSKIEEIAQKLDRNANTLRRAFQIGYDKVMECVRIRLGLKSSPEGSR